MARGNYDTIPYHTIRMNELFQREWDPYIISELRCAILNGGNAVPGSWIAIAELDAFSRMMGGVWVGGWVDGWVLYFSLLYLFVIT